MVSSQLLTVLRKNAYFLFFLFCISIAVYLNSLHNEFAIVDDLHGYIDNTQIRSIPASLKTFHIQNIAYALNYHFFGINPLPLRILTIVDHAIAAVFIFLIIYYTFGKKIAMIASLLFAVHPVNTESVNWISAQFYILMANFQFAAILSHLVYRKTNNKRFIYLTAGIIILYLLLFQHPWVLTAPLVIIAIDFFILRHTFDLQFHKKFWLILAPVLILYFIIRFPQTYHDRMSDQNEKSGKVLLNEQAIIPIIESYPYSVYNMFRLYTFPKDLTIYYDGKEVTTHDRLLMYTVFILYGAGVIYAYRTNRKLCGLLVLLSICIAPVFSPIKVTWYITERYLYFGCGFFTTLLGILFVFLEKKITIKYSSYVLTGIFLILFSIRTYTRTTEWKNPETLAFATIQSAPKSVRAYNDVAGYYVLHDRTQEAKIYYEKALAIYPSIVAMNNLGYIYMMDDLDPSVRTMNQPYEDTLILGNQAIQQKEFRLALYYLNEIYTESAKDINLLHAIATSMMELGSYANAKKYLDISLKINPQNADTYFLYGYLSFKTNDTKQAINYLEKVLKMQPGHVAAQSNLDFLRQPHDAIIPNPSLPNPAQR
ncbi:tetratricopeptide repeat protein [Candidatus Woesebacteria bacterium]|nr:tetratricopeptide repeat protein [Candidatus Woesebacteria bacterium]